MYLRKAPRQGGKPSMQQMRISTAQVLLASCMRATLFWKPRRWSGLHSRSMPITLSVMLSRRAVSASASITKTVDTSLSLTCAGAKLGSMRSHGMCIRAPSEPQACCTGADAIAQDVQDIQQVTAGSGLMNSSGVPTMQVDHVSGNYLLHHTLWPPLAL